MIFAVTLCTYLRNDLISSDGNLLLRGGTKTEQYVVISMSNDFKFRTLISIWPYMFCSPFTSLEDYILDS